MDLTRSKENHYKYRFQRAQDFGSSKLPNLNSQTPEKLVRASTERLFSFHFHLFGTLFSKKTQSKYIEIWPYLQIFHSPKYDVYRTRYEINYKIKNFFCNFSK